MLVKDGIRAAEEMGVGIFVMAYKAGRNIYLCGGFRQLEERSR